MDAGGAGRDAVLKDVTAAKAILAQRPGRVLAISDDGNVDRIIFLQLEGRPHMRFTGRRNRSPPPTPWPTRPCWCRASIRSAARPWRPLYVGQVISVYANPARP